MSHEYTYFLILLDNQMGRLMSSFIFKCYQLFSFVCDVCYTVGLLIRVIKFTGFVFTIPVHLFDGVGYSSAGID